jgi:hypothetical protein
VDGVIVPDLPLEESEPVREAARRHGLGVVLFVAPTSGRARVEAVAAAEPAFIYGVADLGVTGERSTVSEHAESLASLVRSVTDVPLVLGVGISTPEQAAAAARVADGFIVGSVSVMLRSVRRVRSYPRCLLRDGWHAFCGPSDAPDRPAWLDRSLAIRPRLRRAHRPVLTTPRDERSRTMMVIWGRMPTKKSHTIVATDEAGAELGR